MAFLSIGLLHPGDMGAGIGATLDDVLQARYGAKADKEPSDGQRPGAPGEELG
jgi:hypothetical protein